jgi:hypothetical protein
MEFSYKLTEAEYLLASSIVIKRPKRPWARVLSNAYLAALFLAIWGTFLAGMVLERNDLVGVTARDLANGNVVRGVSPTPLLSASILPAAGLFCLLLIVTRLLFRLPILLTRKEHFRSDPGCQAETTVSATAASISFRSAIGSSENIWGGYSTWAERNGILVLVSHAGVRSILKIAELSERERAELRSILGTALPKK